jgi:hypothetical protein
VALRSDSIRSITADSNFDSRVMILFYRIFFLPLTAQRRFMSKSMTSFSSALYREDSPVEMHAMTFDALTPTQRARMPPRPATPSHRVSVDDSAVGFRARSDINKSLALPPRPQTGTISAAPSPNPPPLPSSVGSSLHARRPQTQRRFASRGGGGCVQSRGLSRNHQSPPPPSSFSKSHPHHPPSPLYPLPAQIQRQRIRA